MASSRTSYEQQILRLQKLNVHSAETIQERFGEPLAATSLLQGVLCCKQVEGRRALESLPQLCDEHLCSVIQHSVQALQHALPC